MQALGLEGSLGIILSHDCDLPQSIENEPLVEIIPAKIVSCLEGTYTHAKNPRKLHLEIAHSTNNVFVELLAPHKTAVNKAEINKYGPHKEYCLTPDNLNILKNWLTRRYVRGAFPNAFNTFMSNSKLAEGLKKLVAPTGNDLIAVYFDVDAGIMVERTDPKDPYNLYINLLYTTENHPESAQDTIDTLATKIKQLFEKKEAQGNSLITLEGCDSISAAVFPYKLAIEMKRWSFEHLSLSNPDQPILEIDN
jgi:hypothetical protein